MDTVKSILVVGAGGIGSYLVEHLDKAITYNQLRTSIVLADNDQVEVKNLSYQNFGKEEVGENKAQALSTRFQCQAFPFLIEEASELEPFDLIISAVDNTKFRQLLFSSGKDWIDLRSEGRQVAAFCSSGNTQEAMLATLPVEVKSGSCQRAHDFSKGIVQNGNKIIAAIGGQLVLNWYRGEKNPPRIIVSV